MVEFGESNSYYRMFAPVSQKGVNAAQRSRTRKMHTDVLTCDTMPPLLTGIAARQKIETQKRTILEGSQEWDILYRKYYNEEVKKLGV